MKRRSISVVIFLAVFALAAVIIIQLFWVNKALNIQEDQVAIQQKTINMEKVQFENTVSLALIRVRDRLISLNEEASAFYLDPVKQINENYFVVSFYDTLNPDLLKSYLIDEFERKHILESFEYGIYDCFTDSIIYDKYVGLSQHESASDSNLIAPQQKWDHDGHYFGVYFPDRKHRTVSTTSSNISSSLIVSSFIIILIIGIFAYAISVILKQKRLSEVKTDFINNMTHELKTPISTINISSDVLLRDDISENPERIKQYARIIKSENDRLENQVERVLQLAKLEKGEIVLKKATIDVHQIIEEVAHTFRINIENREGSLALNLNASNATCDADPVHLKNVISNLLDNANKYTPDTPNIAIETSNQNGSIAIQVSDNGKGMTREHLKNVFEKFYRVPTGNLHDVKGFGLGLYYVKTTVEAHGGSIDVWSTPNQGSRFTVNLPLKTNSHE